MKNRMRTIVVGVSELRPEERGAEPRAGDPVLEAAGALADRTGASLHVAHALDPSPGASDGRAGDAPPHPATEHSRQLVEQRLRQLTGGIAARARITCHCLSGDAAVELGALASELHAGLVIIGATPRAGIRHDIVGHTAERVLQHAPVPVLLVRHRLRPSSLRVLLTTDLSAFSHAFHEAALDLVEALHGAQPVELQTLLVCWVDASTTGRVSRDVVVAVAQARLDEFLEASGPRFVDVSGKVRFGNPSTEIVGEAVDWKPDILVLGSHGRWGGPTTRLGSTLVGTLRGSSFNALVIPIRYAVRRFRPADESALGAVQTRNPRR